MTTPPGCATLPCSNLNYDCNSKNVLRILIFFQDGNSALHIACIHGYLECAKSLIDSGATLDLPNSVCATPLHLALSAKHSHVAMYLLHAGADCDVQDWVSANLICVLR